MLLHRRSTLSICAALALAAVVLTGCGGKSSADRSHSRGDGAATARSTQASSTRTVAPTESPVDPQGRSFVAQADPLCRETNQQLARSSAQGKSKGPDLVAALIRNETIERRAMGRLAKLTPPAGLVPDWRKMLRYRQSLADQLGRLAAAVRVKAKASEEHLISAKKRSHRQLREVAGKAGFKDCAKVG